MVRLQYPRDDARFRDGHFDTGIDLVGDPEDPPVRDVPEEAVDHFESYGWERADSADASDQAQAQADDGDSDAADDADADFDAAGFVDRNVAPVAEDLETGDYDDRLDAIEDAERADGSPRKGVLDAIDARRSDGA